MYSSSVKLFIILLSALICSACQTENGEVNLYSARKEALIKPLLDQFTQETGIQVNVISSKAQEDFTVLKKPMFFHQFHRQR